jgi:tRNA (Thr-GGU) A37 N-methylase
MRIVLNQEYIPATTNLDSFSYIKVLWWFSKCDNSVSRSKLIEKSPYKNAPDRLETFATRSLERPNPIALTYSYVSYIDSQNGIIGLTYIDAEDGTPVLDIKPYTPSLDRAKNPSVPKWCDNWPKNVEESGDFDRSTAMSTTTRESIYTSLFLNTGRIPVILFVKLDLHSRYKLLKEKNLKTPELN